jgi:hypothetical protein
MHGKAAARLAHDFDLPSGNGAIAQNTDALVVERVPFPAQIGCLEEREFFFREKRRSHSEKRRLNRIRVLFKIGNRAEEHIGQTPNARKFRVPSRSRLGNLFIGIFPTAR